jgi:hypothetical protein
VPKQKAGREIIAAGFSFKRCGLLVQLAANVLDALGDQVVGD